MSNTQDDPLLGLLTDIAEGVAAHLQAPRIAVWKPEREGFGLTGREISAYTVSGVEEL